jgi:aldehyde dehydrogenase (NAD+)
MRQPRETADIPSLVQKQRAFFSSQATLPLQWRLEKLAALERAIRANEARVYAALHADLGKGEAEAFTTELSLLYTELKHTRKNLQRWAKPRRARTPLLMMPGASLIYPEPLGVALVIAPWNYPYQLTLVPLVGALAAGCTVVVKPSELAPATARVVEDVLGSVFDAAHVAVVQGGPEVSRALLAERWDTLFFTGSTRVGRLVAEAAARHLTPVTLELGGKSPAIVDARTDVATTARRIAWGKFTNAGQTCVAPDYVLVHRRVKDELVEGLRTAVREFYGPEPAKSPDYGRIVSDSHFRRLEGLKAEGRVVIGGQSDAAQRYLAPTVLEDVALESPLMQEEIFGPLLPIVPVEDVGEAVRFVRERPRPLACYLFSQDAESRERVLRETSSGGVVVNDTLLHLANPDLPFGGVGPSGLGRYHGQASFEAFSHMKSVLVRPFALDVRFRYPPFARTLPLLRRLLG